MIDLEDLSKRHAYIRMEWMAGCWSIFYGESKDKLSGGKFHTDWDVVSKVSL